MRWLALIAIGILAQAQAVGLRVASFNIGAHGTTSSEGVFYFDYSLGAPGTEDHDSVRDVIARIDPDVVALQEVHAVDIEGASDDLDALAASLGMPHIHIATTTGEFDTALFVVFLSRFPFLETDTVRSPTGAKELTRNFPLVKVDVPGTDADPVIVSAHLKSGTASDDRFRRAVEMTRLNRFLQLRGVTRDDPFILLGDFNPNGNTTVFDEIPSGVPSGFQLGGDISLPLEYVTDMSSYLGGLDLLRLDPRQLDPTDSPATYETGSVLDLIFLTPRVAARSFASEIYRSDYDTAGGGLPKSGTPPDPSVSAQASDHYVVFVDVDLEDPPDFVLSAPGASVAEDFDGFSGLAFPAGWSGGDEVWLGGDDGSSPVSGGRAYGSGNERAAGFAGGDRSRVLEAEFVNGSTELMTMLDVSYLAEQWRSSFGGAADRIEVELDDGTAVVRLDDLDFSARTDLADGAVPGGSPASRAQRVRGLSIGAGESFVLRFRFIPGEGAGSPPGSIFINEFHYDNSGADSGEFVEVVVGPGFTGSIPGVGLLLYNGAGGTVYHSTTLDTFDEVEVTAAGFRVFSKQIAGIQNGGPDGLALVVDGVAVEFLSYEGTFTATDGAADGMVSVDVGVEQTPAAAAGFGSIRRTGVGAAPGDFTWVRDSETPFSLGGVNDGQDLVSPGLPGQGIGIDDISVTWVADLDGDGLANDEDPDDDNDGLDDIDELAFGSDPLDPGSRFSVTIAEGADGPVLVFPTAVGIDYVIEWCDDLLSWDRSQTIGGDGAVAEFAIPRDERRLFFRVRAGD